MANCERSVNRLWQDTYTAEAALSNTHRLLKLGTAATQVVVATDSASPIIGVMPDNKTYAINANVDVQIYGRHKAVAAGSISAKQPITATTGGAAVVLSTSGYCAGYALMNASSGDVFEYLLLPPGTWLPSAIVPRTLFVNTFQYPAPGTDFTPEKAGAGLANNKSAKKVWIPISGVYAGDKITAYGVYGQITNAGGDTNTVDAELFEIANTGGAGTSKGAITQISKTADFTFTGLTAADGYKDSTDVTVTADKSYVIEVTVTTGATAVNAVVVLGAMVTVTNI